MKKVLACAAVAAAIGSYADEAFTFVTDPSGYSYIQINQDVESFKLDISKYGEANAQDNSNGQWGEGHFKYYTYKGDVQKSTTTTGYGRHQNTTTTLKDSATGEAIETTTIAKGSDRIDLGALSAGTKIGFAFDDRGTDEWAFKFTDSGYYQNGGRTYYTYNAADGEKLVNFNQASYTGHGGGNNNWDDWMVISASATTSPVNAPSGAPLPGALAVLLVGGFGAGALKMGKRRQRA